MESPPKSNPSSQPSPTFPRFNDLPLELRLTIWELSLEPTRPSFIGLHVHRHHVMEQDGDDDDPESTPFQTEIRWITECTPACKCRASFLVKRPHPLTPPSFLFVCRESWAVARKSYGVHFDQIYDSATDRPWERLQHSRMLQLRPPEMELNPWLQRRIVVLDNGRRDIQVTHNDRSGKKVTRLVKRGVYACPSVDYFGISVDLTMRGGWETLDHFIGIAEHEVAFASTIQTFLVQFVLGNRPYVWPQWRDSDAWKHLGVDSSWVRAKELIKFERLKEVVVIMRGQLSVSALPREWRTWKVKQWREELMELKTEWPARWRGVMPTLTFKKLDFTVLVTDEDSPVAV